MGHATHMLELAVLAGEAAVTPPATCWQVARRTAPGAAPRCLSWCHVTPQCTAKVVPQCVAPAALLGSARGLLAALTMLLASLSAPISALG
jgi:hypothetical protein